MNNQDSTNTIVDALLGDIRNGGEGAQDAATTLGLLIERERKALPAGNDNDVALPANLRDYHLSKEQTEYAVRKLSELLEASPQPLQAAVWALKCATSESILPTLLDVFKRTVGDLASDGAAMEALHGIIIFGTSNPEFLDETYGALNLAAERGTEQTRELAQNYLALHPRP